MYFRMLFFHDQQASCGSVQILPTVPGMPIPYIALALRRVPYIFLDILTLYQNLAETHVGLDLLTRLCLFSIWHITT